MVRKLFFILFLSALSIYAQDYNLLYSYNGKQATLFFTVAPDFDQQIVVLRRTGTGEFIALNKEMPLKSIEEVSEIEPVLGSSFAELMEYTGAENNDVLGRMIRGKGVEATLISLLFPGAARVAGRVFTDSTATQGTDYEYKVVYYDLLDRVVKEFTKKVKAVSVSPVSPSNLKAQVKSGMMYLEWDYPKWESDNTNLAVKYYVYRKAGKGNFVKINEKLILRNDDSRPGYSELVKGDIKEAEYYVTAVDISGVESKPSKSIAVKLVSEDRPEPPGGIKAYVERDRISIVWDVASDLNLAGYNVYRKEKSKQDSLRLNKKPVPAGNPIFTDSTAKSAVIYYYYVTTLSAAGKESRLSSLAVGEILDTIPPAAPTGIKISQFGDFVKLEWKASKSGDIKHYNIYRGESRTILSKTGSTTNTTFVDSGYDGRNLVAGQLYFYSISATDNVEIEGEMSDTVQFKYIDKVAPPAPQPVTAKAVFGNALEVRVGMTPVADLAKVNVYRKVMGGTANKQLLKSFTHLPLVFTDSTGKLNESYVYSAESIDSSGNKSPIAESNAVTVKDLLLPAGVPQVNAIHKLDGKYEISWVAVFEKDLAGYNVYRSELPNGNFTLLNNKPVKETKYFDIQGKSSYFYKVRAVDTSGNLSEWSPAAGVVNELPREDKLVE